MSETETINTFFIPCLTLGIG